MKLIKTKALGLFIVLIILISIIFSMGIRNTSTFAAAEARNEQDIIVNADELAPKEQIEDDDSSSNTVSTYSADNYNLVRHNYSAGTNEFLYFTNSAATMYSLSSALDEQTLRQEGFFPDSELDEYSIAPTSIIGTDDRVRVDDTTQKPFRSVCRIVTRYSNIKDNVTNGYVTLSFIGTGFLVGKDRLMTAGHVIYGDASETFSTLGNRYDDGIYNPRFPDEIIIQPGAYLDSSNRLVLPYGEFTVDQSYIQKEYYTSTDTNYDWGLCILGSDIGLQLGYLGLVTNSSTNSISSNNIRIIGYPGDKNGDMYSSLGTVSNVTQYRITHNADTTGGSSGSPVLEQGSDFYVEAIHTTGSSSGNGATRISLFMFNLSFSLSRADLPCEVLRTYFVGSEGIQYNCVVNVVYMPPENCNLLISTDGITFNRTITKVTQEFYSSTTSSAVTEFSYKYYKTYNKIDGTYSAVKQLHNYTDLGISAKYAIKAKTATGAIISTSYDQSGNLWSHGGKTSQVIKGTIVHNGEAKNIEVSIPWIGYKSSSSVVVGGVTFQLRTGPNRVSIKASTALTCSSSTFFAFAVV
ncbi:MAG: trypsin-like serine peptidase [Lachnospira sp.]